MVFRIVLFEKLNQAMSKIQYEDKSMEYLSGSIIVGNALSHLPAANIDFV